MLNHMHALQQKNQHLPQPFQPAQLLLNQHCQKARQRYNKLAPLTICWSCCSIVCLFKTRARTHTHTRSDLTSWLSAAIIQTRDLSQRSIKRQWIKPMQSNSHSTGALLGFCSFTTSKTKACPHCSSLEDKGVKILIPALDRERVIKKKKEPQAWKDPALIKLLVLMLFMNIQGITCTPYQHTRL